MRRLVVCLLVVVPLFGGCGDDDAFPPPTGGGLPPHTTGTTPVFAGSTPIEVASWSWQGFAPPDDVIGAIGEALVGTGITVVLPSDSTLDDGTGRGILTFNSAEEPGQGIVAGSGRLTMWTGTDDGTIVTVTTPPTDPWCPDDTRPLLIRGDDGCGRDDGGPGVDLWWGEGGRLFGAALGEDLDLDDAVVWLESWSVVP